MKVRMVKVDNNRLRVDERDAVAFERYKQRFAEGTEIVAEFKKASSPTSERAFMFFHVLRDLYASAAGYDREFAKNELCLRFGVSVPIDHPQSPPWSGNIVEMYGQKVLRKSLSEYTPEELSDLIEGTILACVETDVPVGDLIADYRRGL